MTMSLVCTSTNTISKQEHMATPSLHDQPFIDTTKSCSRRGRCARNLAFNQSIKLKGGVFEPRQDVDGVSGLREAFAPEVPLRIDPNALVRRGVPCREVVRSLLPLCVCNCVLQPKGRL
jgi:hypothetical protein